MHKNICSTHIALNLSRDHGIKFKAFILMKSPDQNKAFILSHSLLGAAFKKNISAEAH